MRKWAIVTGAGTGIGQAVTRALPGSGVHVLAVGRRQEPLDAVAAAAPFGVVHPLQGDISEEEVIEKIAEAIPQDDHLCYLIQNAAVGVPSRLADLKRGDFEYAMAVNVTAPLFLTQRLLPKLKASKGRILHLGTGVWQILFYFFCIRPLFICRSSIQFPSRDCYLWGDKDGFPSPL